jgi:hypothetical protein
MRRNGLIVMIGICVVVLLIGATVGAADYKSWIPLLPKTVSGLPQAGEPDGMNMESEGQKWSMLHQRYAGDNTDQSVEVTFVSGGGAPFVANFQMMSKMEMETEEQIMKTVEVSKYKGLINLEKKEKRGTLMVGLTESKMIVVEVDPANEEKDLISAAVDLPLEEFAAQAE